MRTTVLLVLGLIALLGLAIAWQAAVWRECRDAGHSRLFCLRMVTR